MVVLQAVRSNTLPEGVNYPDEGCNLHPYCLACPLPMCRYDVKGGMMVMRAERRRAEANELRRQGMALDEIADWLRVSKRTVQRILEGA